jgi:hypothetical protein
MDASLARVLITSWAQVIDDLARNAFTILRKYTATDISAAFGPTLLQTVRSPTLEFKASCTITLTCTQCQQLSRPL